MYNTFSRLNENLLFITTIKLFLRRVVFKNGCK